MSNLALNAILELVGNFRAAISSALFGIGQCPSSHVDCSGSVGAGPSGQGQRGRAGASRKRREVLCFRTSQAKLSSQTLWSVRSLLRKVGIRNISGYPCIPCMVYVRVCVECINHPWPCLAKHLARLVGFWFVVPCPSRSSTLAKARAPEPPIRAPQGMIA